MTGSYKMKLTIHSNQTDKRTETGIKRTTDHSQTVNDKSFRL
jgi:hypothetical protein